LVFGDGFSAVEPAAGVSVGDVASDDRSGDGSAVWVAFGDEGCADVVVNDVSTKSRAQVSSKIVLVIVEVQAEKLSTTTSISRIFFKRNSGVDVSAASIKRCRDSRAESTIDVNTTTLGTQNTARARRARNCPISVKHAIGHFRICQEDAYTSTKRRGVKCEFRVCKVGLGLVKKNGTTSIFSIGSRAVAQKERIRDGKTISAPSVVDTTSLAILRNVLFKGVSGINRDGTLIRKNSTTVIHSVILQKETVRESEARADSARDGSSVVTSVGLEDGVANGNLTVVSRQNCTSVVIQRTVSAIGWRNCGCGFGCPGPTKSTTLYVEGTASAEQNRTTRPYGPVQNIPTRVFELSSPTCRSLSDDAFRRCKSIIENNILDGESDARSREYTPSISWPNNEKSSGGATIKRNTCAIQSECLSYKNGGGEMNHCARWTLKQEGISSSSTRDGAAYSGSRAGC